MAAAEPDIVLVIINGVRRYGQVRLMSGLGGLEQRSTGGLSRRLNLRQDNIAQSVADLSLGQAEDRLHDALQRLPELAHGLEQGAPRALRAGPGNQAMVSVGSGAIMPTMPAEGSWFLNLDHESGGGEQRPKLMLDGLRTGVFPSPVAAGVPLSQLLEPVALDQMAAVDDATFWTTLGGEQNLPAPIRDGLFALYGRRTPAAPVGQPK